MRHLYFTIVLFFLVRVIAAQSGFSQMVLLPNSMSCNISGVVTDNDTIVCYGGMYGTNEGKWGVFLAKFDSNGVFLQMSTVFDSAYEQTVNPMSQLIRTSDGGYLGVGSQGVGKKTAAYKFSHDGTLEWSHFYRENAFQVVLTCNAQELADGYLCFGWFAEYNDDSNFTMKISKSGELMWFSRAISKEGYSDKSRGRLASSGDNFIIGSGITSLNANDTWSKTNLMEIDTNGQIVWEWLGEIASKETGATSLALSPEGNIVFAVARYYTNALNGLSSQLKFRCIEPNTGNLLWQTEFPSFQLNYERSIFSQMKPSTDGNGFDAIGYNAEWYGAHTIQGLLAHYDWDGHLQWFRYDTVHVDTVYYVSENKLYNMAHLSSGSIIGVGDVKRSDPYPHLEGWLIKWSADGCMASSYCGTTGTQDNWPDMTGTGYEKWNVYPNPAHDYTWLSPPQGVASGASWLLISDASGRQLRYQFLNGLEKEYRIALDGLTQGLYFYTIRSPEGIVHQSGRLVVY